MGWMLGIGNTLPRERVILILLPLDRAHAEDGLERLWHTDDGDEFDECFSQSTHERLSLGRALIFGFGDQVEVEIFGEAWVTSSGNRCDLDIVLLIGDLEAD